MTQPPYGDQPRPYGDRPQPYGDRPPSFGGAGQPPYSEPLQYPHQELLPQQVQPGRSRLPLIVGAVVVVVAVVAALVVWRFVHDDGEDNRAAYCQQLKTLTSGDGLSGLADAAGNGGTVVPKAITTLVGLAPGSVKNQWNDLVDLVQAGADPSNVGQIARAFSDLQTIIADANSGCGMDLQFPG